MPDMTNDPLQPFEAKMTKTISVLDEDFNTIRAGRANPKILDQIMVDYYGSPTPINQVANVQVPEARMIVITPWDTKMLRDLARAIQMSDIGINPQNDGKCIRLAFPVLTEERRRDLTKEVAQLGEAANVAIRNIRREALDKFRRQLKDKAMPEDDFYSLEADLQKLTDKFTGKVDAAVAAKDKELMEF